MREVAIDKVTGIAWLPDIIQQLDDLGLCYWVAYSGGMDSHVLLHLLTQYRQHCPALQLRAVHVVHGLSPYADQWASHCASVCQVLSVPLTCQKVQVQLAKQGLEAAARQARYQAFRALMGKNDVLLLAHHQRDQAETLMLRLLRGSGVKGLAGMPWRRRLGEGQVLRPLLHIPYAQLRAYAEQQQLQWIEDESNRHEHLSRNYVRQQLLPRIRAHWPAADKTLARVADVCYETQTLLDEIANQDMVFCAGQTANTLSVTQLSALSSARRNNVLRAWLREHLSYLPSQQQLMELVNTVLRASPDAAPSLWWMQPEGMGYEIKRYRDDLYAVLRTQWYAPTTPSDWDFSAPTKEIAGITLQLSQALGQGISPAFCQHKRIQVAFRHGGERMQPYGRVGSHPLKKLLQEWQIPPWQRAKVPLILADGQLIAVVGYAVAASACASAHEYGWLIRQVDT